MTSTCSGAQATPSLFLGCARLRAVILLSVPELTRSASVQLNERVSLQGHAKAIA
jgi:hypothetical protein